VDRLFAASFQRDIIKSRLVTLELADQGIFGNNPNSILSVSISIGSANYLVPANGNALVDFGNAEGKREIKLTANHRDGSKSKARFLITLMRMKNGTWFNNKDENGLLTFEMTKSN